ncbi:MAG TPA: neutral zinc metallopeptidase [Thermomicrobiales bacterium]|nr:neutral zinc metallopeptidase [Thermomicrobiales bacterium]
MLRHRILAFCFALLLLVGALPSAVRADTASDSKAALAQARQIFRYGDTGDFNAMYDLLHPDAQAVIPRDAAVGALQAIYGADSVGRGVPVGVEFGSWTWGVTGQTYDNAAAVDFELPYEDNGVDKTIEDTMYLVADDQGEWRWFLGNSEDFVESLIANYSGSIATNSTALTDGDIIENTVKDLDDFYRGAFEYTDLTYRSPKVVIVQQGDSADTACGPAATGFWAFYCPGDVTVYLDEAFLTELGKKAPFAESFVIAHEWAHHVQTSVGLVRVSANERPAEWNQVFSIELELMADCMAGAWAKDVSTRGLMTETDIEQTVDFTIQYLGDPDYISDYDPQAHGSAQQRADAIMAGYNDGFLSCNIVV